MGCLFVQVRFSSAQSAPPETIVIATFISCENVLIHSLELPVTVSCVGLVLRVVQRDVLPSAEAELVLPLAGAAFLSAPARAESPLAQATEASLWALARAESLLPQADAGLARCAAEDSVLCSAQRGAAAVASRVEPAAG